MSIREDLLAALAGREGVDQRERDSLVATRAFLDASEELFDETTTTHHITASAFVVSSRGVILHRHRRLGIWVQPGGHVDAGESPATAALRETREETGLAVTHWAEEDLFHVDVHDGPRGHVHYDLRYLLRAPADDPQPPPDESPDVFWFDFAAALERAEPALGAALRALAVRVGANLPD